MTQKLSTLNDLEGLFDLRWVTSHG